MFDEEERQMKRRDVGSSRTIVGKYARYGEHMNWIKEQAELFPDLVSTYVEDYTIEGRELRVIVIGTSQATKKIWIDCGIHAVKFNLKINKSRLMFNLRIVAFISVNGSALPLATG